MVHGHTVPHWKALSSGKYYPRWLSCGSTNICQDVPKRANLLHKWGFDVPQTHTTVNIYSQGNKHYINRITLNWAYKPQKSCHGFGLLSWNRYVIDFSNEVLNVARISEVKVGGQKNLLVQLAPGPGALGWSRAKFFRPPALTSNIFAAPQPKLMFSTSFQRSKTYLFQDRSPRPCHDFWGM